MADQVRYDAGEGSDSIDDLLSSALAEQTREKRMLVDAVHGAREALRRAENELAQMKDLVTSRDETLSEVLLRVQTIEEWANRVSAQMGDLPATVGEAVGSSEEIDAKLRTATEELLTDIREDQVEVVRALGRTFEIALTDVKKQLAATRQDYLDQLTAATEQIIEKNDSTAELMVEHLVGYLAKRDETMHQAREQMLIDQFRKLGAALGSRQGKKVAKALGSIESNPAKPPPPAPAPRFKVPGLGRKERRSPAGPGPRSGQAPRQGSPHRQAPHPEGPIQLPTREFVDRGYGGSISGGTGFDDGLSRADLEREYLIPQPRRSGPEVPRNTERWDSDDDFFETPEPRRRTRPTQGPDWMGEPPRNA